MESSVSQLSHLAFLLAELLALFIAEQTGIGLEYLRIDSRVHGQLGHVDGLLLLLLRLPLHLANHRRTL